MNEMYHVIMAGGIGSRFWPMSRKNKPKQFLNLFQVLDVTYSISPMLRCDCTNHMLNIRKNKFTYKYWLVIAYRFYKRRNYCVNAKWGK